MHSPCPVLERSERERERERKDCINLDNIPLGSEATKRRKNTTRATTSHHRRTTGTHGYHGNGKPHPLTRSIQQENPITCTGHTATERGSNKTE